MTIKVHDIDYDVRCDACKKRGNIKEILVGRGICWSRLRLCEEHLKELKEKLK